MSTIDEVLNYARAQIGKPYAWGAEGPNSFDCSGLVWASYRASGIYLPRTTAGLISAGTAVGKFALIAGDLVFPQADHVQIYVGSNYIIEAPRAGLKVREVEMWGFYVARRIVPSNNGPVYPGSPIELGSRGANVVRVQHIVGTTPDGIFGPKTRAAVIKWQASHGLVADGIVGPKTWGAMFG